MWSILLASASASAGFLVLLLFPSDAFAWGIGAHILFSSTLLENLGAVSAPIAGLLGIYPEHFFYGNIAADVILAKNLARYVNHCHNWKAAHRIMAHAASPQQKAFAAGFLSHLAADSVAHNYFIPLKLIESYWRRGRTHVYWELRFDSALPPSVWKLSRRIDSRSYPEDDELLEKLLKPPILPFGTHRRIFAGIRLLHRLDHWKTAMEALNNRSKLRLDPAEARRFTALSVSAMREALCGGEHAPVLRSDPTGRAAQKTARSIRAFLRRRLLIGRRVMKTSTRIIEMLDPYMRAASQGEKHNLDLSALLKAAGKGNED